MVNQKCFTSQHQLGKMLNNEMLRLWLKKLNLNTKDFCKMINDKVDPKVLRFSQEIIVNSADTIKSYLSPSYCDE